MRAIWVRTVVILVLLTLVARERALLLWAVAAVAACLLGAPLVNRLLRGLAVSQAVSTTEAFAGDTVTVHLRVTNRSLLPLPWMRLREVVARRLEMPAPAWLASLPPGESFQAEYRLPLPRRGVYRVGRVEVEVGDWFGLWRRTGDVELPVWLTVFPRPVDPVLAGLPPRRPDGERRQPLSPFLAWEPMGLRAYQPGDPLRWIDWKASARRGDWVVRNFPPVRDTAHMVVVDLHPAHWPERHRALWVEQALAVAAGWILRTGERDEPVGLVMHGRATRYEPPPPGTDAPGDAGGTAVPRARVAASAGPARRVGILGGAPLDEGPLRLEMAARRGPEHRRRLLAALATLEASEDAAFVRSVPPTLGRLTTRASVLWLAGRADAELLAAARTLQLAGHSVCVLVAQGAPGSAAVPGVRLLNLPPGEGPAWSHG